MTTTQRRAAVGQAVSSRSTSPANGRGHVEVGAAAGAPVETAAELNDSGARALLADADDPTQWGEVMEVGPGFYRAPGVANALAALLKQYRATHGLPPQDLAKMLRLHPDLVRSLEDGLEPITVELLVRVARHLRVNISLRVTPADAVLSGESMAEKR